jgi:hypothetical protein
MLVDVSGSMKENFQQDVKPTDQHVTRTESIFKTVIKIAEREVNSNKDQEIFVLAFGLYDIATCDLLYLLESIKTLYKKSVIGYDPLIKLLAENKAPHAREYIEKYLTKEEAAFLYDYYSKNPSDLREIIDDLPEACKDSGLGIASRVTSGVGNSFLPNWFNPIRDKEEKETRKQAVRAIEKAKSNINKRLLEELKAMKVPKTKTFKSTIDLLHEVAGTSSPSSTSKEKSFSAVQLKNLVSSIEPFIYGNTPMCEALRLALQVFNSSTHDDKVLFLLTDGEATDGNPVQFAKELRDKDVHVFVCLITPGNIPCPRRLYYEAEEKWTEAQKDMFELSSTVENSHSAMSVLLEQGWKLPADGQSRLFVQANHPDVIDEFSRLVRHMVESNDVLLNIFGRVSLDKYINSAISEFKPKDQGKSSTCYAHAVAAVFHLAMKRIHGREGEVPEFDILRDELIKVYGVDGANTANVLSKWAPKYRLQYKEVDELGARQAINARRTAVATFRLDKEQWDAFQKFYEDNPEGILERKDLDTHKPLTDLFGHAVVLIKCDPQSLTFMNSWGDDFADHGFFKVRNQSVLNLKFYDVYWTLSDLKESEKEAFNQKRRIVGEDFVRELPVNVQNLPYKCPRCRKSSPAIKFIGHLLEATCPKCKQNFKPTPLGFVLNW